MRRALPRPLGHRPPSGCRGFTLVEMMVSITIGLLLTAALSLIFVNNSRTRVEIERTHQQIENGRFATQLIADELRLAGFYGELDPSVLATPSTLPDPSTTDVASLKAAVALPVQGFDNATSSTLGLPSVVTADFRNGTDVIVIRRASGCVAGVGDCAAMDTSSNTYFQTTLCDTQLTSLSATSQFLIGRTDGEFTSSNPAVSSSPTFLAARDCATAASVRAFFVRFYYLANNNIAGDGIPTLKMAELGAGAWTVTPLVEGIEQMQVEYGLDTGGSDQGAPDSYVTLPASAAQWRQVTTLRLNLLARNTERSSGYTDTRSYVLGKTLDGSGNSVDNRFGPFNDGFRRHVYSSMVRLNNVAGRLE